MKSVALVVHRERPEAHAVARTAAHWLTEHGVEVRIATDEAGIIGLDGHAVAADVLADGVDLVVSVGGDGTMLHAVQLVYPRPVPVVGVNAGQLGYLTSIELTELEPSLARLVAGDFRVSERMVLEVSVRASGVAAGPWFALNEAVLEKVRAGHLVRLEVCVNGSPFTTYAADGVIVATPTGSTAYSFSARGPIASPALQCLLVTPVSPHMLFDRTLLLAADEQLDLVVSAERPVAFTVDGRDVGLLESGDTVTCRAASAPARIVELEPRDFHQLLKAKFELPDR
ncbi:MAG TPA: NAD(+)/NADH kinase [Acidimicrobiia bacterium]|nr:NAD(+)/NADH kinase [Acidimicrobiia bacterium]